MLRHWADVVADATRALKISPKNVDALVSRGRAYQATGQEKKAKVDAQAAAASDSSNEAAKALLESFEPKKAVAGLGGMSLDKPSKASKKGSADADAEEEARKKQAAQILAARQEAEARRQAQQRSWGPPVTVKAVAGADVRTFVVPTMIAHKDLMTALQKKFPDTSAFTVRYSAPDGSLKNVNSRHDFATAVAAAQSGENKGKFILIITRAIRLTDVFFNSRKGPAEGISGRPRAVRAALDARGVRRQDGQDHSGAEGANRAAARGVSQLRALRQTLRRRR